MLSTSMFREYFYSLWNLEQKGEKKEQCVFVSIHLILWMGTRGPVPDRLHFNFESKETRVGFL